MKFYKAVILTPEEREDNPSNNYYDLIVNDYTIQGLLYKRDSQPIIFNNNNDIPIQDMMNSFLLGVEYAGEYVENEKILIIADDSYDEDEVMEKFFNKDYEKLEV